MSGAHINPAVSFAMLLLRRLSWMKFFIYVSAQFIGAFLGAVFIYINYYEKISSLDYDLKTASIFATYPKIGVLGAFFDQIFVTSLLVIVVLAVTDKNNEDLSQACVAALLGIAITIIGISFGYNCGYPLNPARDFAPRL